MEDLLKSILEKISVYDILNNFIPGAVFLILAEDFGGLRLISKSCVNKIFLCYVTGLVISRIGSVIVEPICKKFKIIEFVNHSEFTEADLKDKSGKTERLSMINNVYRTFISVFLCLSLLLLLNFFGIHFFNNRIFQIITSVGVMILFVYSYHKQSRYVSSRVKTVLEQNKKK